MSANNEVHLTGFDQVDRIDLALLMPDTSSTERIKKVVGFAILAHIILIFIHFTPAKVDIQQEVKPPKPVMKVLKIIPPPKIPPPERPKDKKQLVIVPDPTPDEPEPIRPPEPPVFIIPPGVDVVIGIPDGPPAPIGALWDGEAGVIKAMLRFDPDPVYPENARRMGVEGVVTMILTINQNGDVVNVQVIKDGPLGMTESAVEAAKRRKYSPATLNGRPVTVYSTVRVTFEIS